MSESVTRQQAFVVAGWLCRSPRTIGTEACRSGCNPFSIDAFSASMSRLVVTLFYLVRRTCEVARKSAELDTICKFKHAHGVRRMK